MENNGHSEVPYKHVAQAAVVVLTCKHEKSDSACHSCHTSCFWQGSEKCGDIATEITRLASLRACPMTISWIVAVFMHLFCVHTVHRQHFERLLDVCGMFVGQFHGSA